MSKPQPSLDHAFVPKRDGLSCGYFMCCPYAESEHSATLRDPREPQEPRPIPAEPKLKDVREAWAYTRPEMGTGFVIDAGTGLAVMSWPPYVERLGREIGAKPVRVRVTVEEIE